MAMYIELTESARPLGSVVEHSLHTRGVRSSNLLAGTNIYLGVILQVVGDRRLG